MNNEFTVLSLLEDAVAIKKLDKICKELGVSHKNRDDPMDFLEDVLEYTASLMVFETIRGSDQVVNILQMLQQDTLSERIPGIVLCERDIDEALVSSLSDFPIVALYGYEDWDNQVSSLIKTLKQLEGQSSQLHSSLSDSEQKNVLDPLTGALNRRGCERSFEAMVGYYASNKEMFSCMMLDIDHFKKVNDTYGHDSGDEVLVQISQIIQDNIRQDEDAFIRFGGEEFIILLSSCNKEMAKSKAEHLRQEIESSIFTEKSLKITASFGVVEYGAGKSLDKIISEADTYLYQAKENGRNQVCF